MAKQSKKKGSSKKKQNKKSKAVPAVSSRKVSHKGARAKGLQFERDVANAIGHVYPEAKRHLESQADSAQEGRDISNTVPYAIQCKNHQNYCTIKTIREVQRTKENRPVLVTKGNKMEPLVVMYFSDWIKMLEEIKGRELLEANRKLADAILPSLCMEPPKFPDLRKVGANPVLGLGYGEAKVTKHLPEDTLQKFVDAVSALPPVKMEDIDMDKVEQKLEELGGANQFI